MILVVRCAQGVVLFKIHPIGPRQSRVVCLNDGAAATFNGTANPGWIAGLEALFAKCVQLRGTVQQVLTFPDEIH